MFSLSFIYFPVSLTSLGGLKGRDGDQFMSVSSEHATQEAWHTEAPTGHVKKVVRPLNFLPLFFEISQKLQSVLGQLTENHCLQEAQSH